MPTYASLELFLTTCYLSTNGPGSITLADLDLKGSRRQPLDIFVALVSTHQADSREASRTGPDQAWGFPCTDRGKATFLTCLDMFLMATRDGTIILENTLEVLWQTTHFPPAVLSLRELYDGGPRILKPLPCAVLALSFRELSRKIVPPWISSGPESLLESSRQIFGWLYSLTLKLLSPLNAARQSIVHGVELNVVSDREDGSVSDQACNSDPSILTDVRVSKLSADNASSTEIVCQRVLVRKLRPDNVKPETLAAALWGSYSTSNFYFDLPKDTKPPLVHRRYKILNPQDFDNLLLTTNQQDEFNLIGPLQLGACSSATLPVITLDSNGYVSKYDQQDRQCSEREFYTSNFSRTEVLSGADPGQYLLQKLQPIIEVRKKEGTWELDAWDEGSKKVDSRVTKEGKVSSHSFMILAYLGSIAIVVCVDRSSSMATRMSNDWTQNPQSSSNSTMNGWSRLSEVKEVFKNLVTRISAYRLPTHLGLVTFADKKYIRVNQEITPVLYDFKDRLDEVVAQRSTAMFDAMLKAAIMLESFGSINAEAKRRIILLTDGEDNCSGIDPEALCKMLFEHDIVLDTIVIGTGQTRELFKMAKHTGGYAFNPKTRDLLFQNFLLDGFVDINTRPNIQKIAIDNYSLSLPKAADMQTKYDFPPRRSHKCETDNYISLKQAAKRYTRRSDSSSSSKDFLNSCSSSLSSSTTLTNGRTKVSGVAGSGRILANEIVGMINCAHPSMDVYVSESNMSFWKVVMAGPQGPYEKGAFLLTVELGDYFPLRPPSVRFITPVLHPNISKVCPNSVAFLDSQVELTGSKHGQICHEIFNREWHNGIHVYEVLQHIWGIFFSLEVNINHFHSMRPDQLFIATCR